MSVNVNNKEITDCENRARFFVINLKWKGFWKNSSNTITMHEFSSNKSDPKLRLATTFFFQRTLNEMGFVISLKFRKTISYYTATVVLSQRFTPSRIHKKTSSTFPNRYSFLDQYKHRWRRYIVSDKCTVDSRCWNK